MTGVHLMTKFTKQLLKRAWKKFWVFQRPNLKKLHWYLFIGSTLALYASLMFYSADQYDDQRGYIGAVVIVMSLVTAIDMTIDTYRLRKEWKAQKLEMIITSVFVEHEFRLAGHKDLADSEKRIRKELLHKL